MVEVWSILWPEIFVVVISVTSFRSSQIHAGFVDDDDFSNSSPALCPIGFSNVGRSMYHFKQWYQLPDSYIDTRTEVTNLRPAFVYPEALMANDTSSFLPDQVSVHQFLLPIVSQQCSMSVCSFSIPPMLATREWLLESLSFGFSHHHACSNILFHLEPANQN